ncbi:MAG: HAD family phosphatase [Planctomycetes bacterium]|nr:HAD family phosphatase [Planctomycetota bacterium]
MLDAVIFDMDGVLVDSEPMHFATTNEVLAQHGAALDEAFYGSCIGMAERPFFEKVAAHCGLSVPIERLVRDRVARSLERLAIDPLPPREGVLECLLGLVASGRSLAVASSAHRVQVDLVLRRLGIERLFGATVSIDDVEHGKPEPDLFVEAARRLGVSPDACLVVEDAVLGLRAARAAGMSAVAFVAPEDDGAAHVEAGARQVFHELSTLTADLLDDWSLRDASP